MNKKFTILTAALALLTILAIPIGMWGQAPVNTVLWAEDFSGYSANDVPSGSITNSHTGTTVYTGSLTYVCTNGDSETKIYAANLAGGESPELLISKKKGTTPGGTFTISGISTGGATELSLTYKANNSSVTASSSTTGITFGNSSFSSNTMTYTIAVDNASTFSIVFSQTSTSNTRIDDIVLKVKTAGASSSTHKFNTAVLPASSGTVLAKDSGDNTISSGSDVAEGAFLTVTATAETGYKFANWSLSEGSDSDVNDVNENPTDFMMGTEDVTLTANFVAAYTVACATGLSNGSISADMETAVAGETVTITATPDEGYDLNTVTVSETGGSGTVTPTISGNTATFVMPAYNVTVSASFTAKTIYEITASVTPASSGSITVETTAWEGKTVNVSVSPAGGYVFDEITITKTGDSGTTVSYTGNASAGFTFTMPAYAVTVTVTFRTADVYAKYTGALVEGDYVIAYISATSNKALKNTITNNKFNGETISPNGSNQIIDPDASIVWHIAPSGDYWTIYSDDATKYAASTGTKSEAQLLDSGTDNKSLFTATLSSEKYTFVNKYNQSQNVNAYFRWAGSAWACYAVQSGYECTLYKKIVNSTLIVAAVENGTITATPDGGSAIAEGESLSVSNGTTITLSATGDTGYVLDAWDVYKTGDASTKVTVTSNQFTMPDYGVTVSASFRMPTTFTVQYSVNGAIVPGLTQSGIAEGDPVTLPTTGFTVPTGFAYAGWTENEVSAELIGTATYIPTANTTLYLVFVKSGQTLGYNKVTSLDNITPGTYIIVNDNYCLPSVTTTSSPVKSNDYKVTNASSTSNYTSVPANTEWIFTGTKTVMTIKNSEGSYLYSTSSNTGIRVSSTSDTWAFEENGAGFAMKEATNDKYCATYSSGTDWRSYGTADHTNYGDAGVLYLYKKTPVYTRVYNKEITKYTDVGTSSGWHLIASPVATLITDVTNLLSDDYDLYLFNQSSDKEWVNYKANASTFTTLEPGKGYLYANSETITLTFAGVPNNLSGTVTLTKTDAVDFSGWNLVGNPLNSSATIPLDYYKMNGEGSGLIATDKSNAINPMEGVFVEAATNGATLTFTPSAKGTAETINQLVINVGKVKSGDAIDRAIVRFSESNIMQKLRILEGSAEIYIPQDGVDYAIVRSEAQGEMPVNFKAAENGTYTLSIDIEADMDYLHLIDNMTGADVDLLANPSYTFDARTSDYASRFRLVFSANDENGASTGSATFAYFNGSEWVVNASANATLQVVDVMGRVLSSETVNGNHTMNLNLSTGVYMLRLVNGNDVKTQKIVVR